MSKFDVRFNKNALEDLLKTEQAQAGIKSMFDNATRIFDDALASREGKTVEIIKHEISSRIASENNGRLDEPELSTIANLLHSGKRVWMEYDGRIMAED